MIAPRLLLSDNSAAHDAGARVLILMCFNIFYVAEIIAWLYDVFLNDPLAFDEKRRQRTKLVLRM